MQAEGEIARGRNPIAQARRAPDSRREKQTARVWFEDKPPADGAGDGGTWNQVKKDRRAAHTEPYAIGPHGHWFQDDAAGFAVQPGDVLFAYVFIDPQAPPDEILLAVERRQGLGTRRLLGRGPHPTGRIRARRPVIRWTRSRTPAAGSAWKSRQRRSDLEGKTSRGMAFKLSGGQCWWGKSGAVRVEEPTYLVDQTFPMHDGRAGPLDRPAAAGGQGLFRAGTAQREKATPTSRWRSCVTPPSRISRRRSSSSGRAPS